MSTGSSFPSESAQSLMAYFSMKLLGCAQKNWSGDRITPFPDTRMSNSALTHLSPGLRETVLLIGN